MIAASDSGLRAIREKVEAGEPLSLKDGAALYRSPDIHALGAMANLVRERLHGRNVYYNVNLHVNYSNFCVLRCKFCSFYRPYEKDSAQASSGPTLAEGGPWGSGGGYELSVDQVISRALEAYARGATEVHIVGGLHPKLPFSYYTDMMSGIRDACPHMHIKAFTAIEIIHFTRITKPRLSIAEVLDQLRAAGLLPLRHSHLQ